MRRLMLFTAAAAVIQAVFVANAMARPAAGRIQGTVQNSLAQPIAAARLSLRALNGKVIARTTSEVQGHFIFKEVPLGRYTVEARAAAYQAGEAVVSAEAGTGVTVVVTLASEQALTVAVIAHRLNRARNGLSPETGSSVYRFSQQAIHELPQGSNTPMTDLLLQAPGVVQDSYGQLHIRGEHAEIQYRINGIELPEGITSGFSQTLSPRFARSISLLEGALPAQYGDHTAGVVEIQTKSGQSLNGGDFEMYGGQRGTVQPSFELG